MTDYYKPGTYYVTVPGGVGRAMVPDCHVVATVSGAIATAWADGAIARAWTSGAIAIPYEVVEND